MQTRDLAGVYGGPRSVHTRTPSVQELLSQSQLALRQRASLGTELDAATLRDLRLIAINAGDMRLHHAYNTAACP